MPMITVQVKLPEETIDQIDQLRGAELGWSQSGIMRKLIEAALLHRLFLPECSVDRPKPACTEHNKTPAGANGGRERRATGPAVD